jgi:hypothetical protein
MSPTTQKKMYAVSFLLEKGLSPESISHELVVSYLLFTPSYQPSVTE